MAGQGSLCPPKLSERFAPSGRAKLSVCAASLLALLVGFTIAAGHWEAEPPQAGGPAETAGADAALGAGFRLQWSHPGPHRVTLRLAGDAPAQFETIENECRSVTTTGAIQLSADRRELTIRPPGGLADGAVQLRIRGAADTSITIEAAPIEAAPIEAAPHVASGNRPRGSEQSGGSEQQRAASDRATDRASVPATSRRVRLSELLDGEPFPASGGAEAEGAAIQWQLQRLADDRLQLELASAEPLYAPGESLRWTATVGSALEQREQKLAVRWSLHRVADAEVVAEQREVVETDEHGCSPPLELTTTLPKTPGVYELRCRLEENRDPLWSRLRGAPVPLARVARPVVIIGDPPDTSRPSDPAAGIDAAADELPWDSVARIRPADGHSWTLAQWLPTADREPKLLPETPGGKELQQRLHAGEPVTAIPPGRSFQAALPVLSAGKPHRITLRYAAGQPLQLKLEVFDRNRPDAPHGEIVLSQPQQHPTGDAWRTHTWLFYPSRADQQIRVTNLDSHHSAWIESITVEAGPQRLPVNRHETTDNGRMALLSLVDFHWHQALTGDWNEGNGRERFSADTWALHRLFVATTRLRGYLAATGLSGVMVSADHAGRAWYRTETFTPLRDERAADRFRLAMMLRQFDASGYRVLLRVEPSHRLTEVERQLQAEPSIAPALRRTAAGSAYQLWHPLTRRALGRWLGELESQFGEHDSFAGIALACGTGSHAAPPQPEASGGERLAEEFLASGAVTALAAEDRERWLTPARGESLGPWRGRMARQAYEELAEAAGGGTLLLLPGSGATSPDDSWAGLVGGGWPGEATAIDPVQAIRRTSVSSLAAAVRSPVALADVAQVTSPGHRAVLMSMLPAGRNARAGRRRPALQTEKLLIDMTRCAHQLAPEVVIFEVPVALAPLSQEWAELLTALTALPESPGAVIESSDPACRTVGVRLYRKRDHTVVTIVNLAPWASDVELHLSSPAEFSAPGTRRASPASGVTWSADGNRVDVQIPPGRMAVLAAPNPELAIEQWLTRPSGGGQAVARIQQQIRSVVERLGILSDFRRYPALTNGGFEQPADDPGLAPWLHAQHPAGAVRVDASEAIEGKQSVVLTNSPGSSSRTWLVSETIAAPRSGRLAVSLACRGERTTDPAPHRLRIAIEATRDGEPIRQAAPLEIPSNGRWQSRDVVLEVDAVDAADVRDLRLTIDSLSPGRVWLDDVRLHDWFPLTSERSALQNQAFLAVQGLQRGNLTAASRLLQNFWAQYLLAVEPPQAIERDRTAIPHETLAVPGESPTAVDAVDPAKQPVPGVAERIRHWLPQSLRF